MKDMHDEIYFSRLFVPKEPELLVQEIKGLMQEQEVPQSSLMDDVIEELNNIASAQNKSTRCSCSSYVIMHSEQDILAAYWLAKHQLLDLSNDAGHNLEVNGRSTNATTAFGINITQIEGADQWGFGGLKLKSEPRFFW